MKPRLTRWLLAALVISWAPDALANRFLRRATRAYQQLEYDKVTPLLKKALEVSSEPAEEVEIYALLATMHVMYGRDAKAEEAFVRILERQPNFELSADSSPKLAAAFAAAEKTLAGRTPPNPEPKPDGKDDERGDGGDEIDGDGDDPLLDPTLQVTEPAPFYSTWWFWTVVGTVVAGAAGTTTYFLTQPRFPKPDFGPYDL